MIKLDTINMHIKSKQKKEKKTYTMTTASTMNISITKRDGRKENLDINKIHFVVEEACENLPGVSASQIEMNSNIQFYD